MVLWLSMMRISVFLCDLIEVFVFLWPICGSQTLHNFQGVNKTSGDFSEKTWLVRLFFSGFYYPLIWCFIKSHYRNPYETIRNSHGMSANGFFCRGFVRCFWTPTAIWLTAITPSGDPSDLGMLTWRLFEKSGNLLFFFCVHVHYNHKIDLYTYIYIYIPI